MDKNAVSQRNGIDTIKFVQHNSTEFYILSNSAQAVSAWLEYQF